jgi:hypothetical protein
MIIYKVAAEFWKTDVVAVDSREAVLYIVVRSGLGKVFYDTPKTI